MSIVAIEIDDNTPSYFLEYNQLVVDVQTAFGTVSDLTDLMTKKMQAIQNSNHPQEKEVYEDIFNTALVVVEIYLLYVLPVGLFSKASEWISISFAESITGKCSSLVLGLGMGRCLQLFLRMFYQLDPLNKCDCEASEYEALRYEALALLRATETKVNLFAEQFENREIEPELMALTTTLKKEIHQITFDLFQQFPHLSLILEP